MGSFRITIGHNLVECYNFLPTPFNQYIIEFNLKRKLPNFKYYTMISCYLESNASEENKLKIVKKLHSEFLKRQDPELLNTIMRLYAIDDKFFKKEFITLSYNLLQDEKIDNDIIENLCIFLLTKYCDDYEKSKIIIEYANKNSLLSKKIKLDLLDTPYQHNKGKKFKTYVKINGKYLFKNGIKN